MGDQDFTVTQRPVIDGRIVALFDANHGYPDSLPAVDPMTPERKARLEAVLRKVAEEPVPPFLHMGSEDGEFVWLEAKSRSAAMTAAYHDDFNAQDGGRWIDVRCLRRYFRWDPAKAARLWFDESVLESLAPWWSREVALDVEAWAENSGKTIDRALDSLQQDSTCFWDEYGTFCPWEECKRGDDGAVAAWECSSRA